MTGKTEDWSYIAGLFDGEGNIAVSYCGKHGRSTGRGMYRIAIANTHQDTILWLQQFLGFGVVSTRYRNHKKWRPCYVYRVSNLVEVAQFLCGVLPYLQIKKEQAEIALAIIDSRFTSLVSDYHAPISEREYEMMAELSEERNKLSSDALVYAPAGGY